jgi:hypothetical protein
MPKKKKASIEKPKRSKLEIVAHVLQTLVLIVGISQFIFGESGIGLLIILSWAVITIPSFFTRKRILTIPLEIQFLLFVMVFLQFIVGEAWDFYTNGVFPHYDKFVHVLLPFMVAVISFIIAYTWYATGKLYASKKVMFLIIFLITLGVGALWEIFEYGSDELLYPVIPGWHHFQGSPTEDALHDTMNDLIADAIGGIAGGLLSIYYISRLEKKSNPRLKALVTEVSTELSRTTT